MLDATIKMQLTFTLKSIKTRQNLVDSSSMLFLLVVVLGVSSAMGFAPFASMGVNSRSHSIGLQSRSTSFAKLSMALGVDEKVIVIGESLFHYSLLT